jgi:hypothetical protein
MMHHLKVNPDVRNSSANGREEKNQQYHHEDSIKVADEPSVGVSYQLSQALCGGVNSGNSLSPLPPCLYSRQYNTDLNYKLQITPGSYLQQPTKLNQIQLSIPSRFGCCIK